MDLQAHIKEDFSQHEQIKAQALKQQNTLDELYRATFGDMALNEKGDHEKIKEIHELLVQGNTIRKFTIWIFGALLAAIGAIATIVHLLKDISIKDK